MSDFEIQFVVDAHQQIRYEPTDQDLRIMFEQIHNVISGWTDVCKQ